MEWIGLPMYPQPMTADAGPLERLADEVERRITNLGLEYAEVARLGGFSIETLSKIRKGQRARVVTYRRLERALKWEVGSVDDILTGGTPTLVSEADDGSAESAPTQSDASAEVDPRAQAVLTILEELPTRVQAEVLRRLGDRLPLAARPERGAKSRGEQAG